MSKRNKTHFSKKDMISSTILYEIQWMREFIWKETIGSNPAVYSSKNKKLGLQNNGTRNANSLAHISKKRDVFKKKVLD